VSLRDASRCPARPTRILAPQMLRLALLGAAYLVGHAAAQQVADAKSHSSFPMFSVTIGKTQKVEHESRWLEATSWEAKSYASLFVGHDFDLSTGRFTARRAGTYFASANIRLDNANKGWFTMMVGRVLHVLCVAHQFAHPHVIRTETLGSPHADADERNQELGKRDERPVRRSCEQLPRHDRRRDAPPCRRRLPLRLALCRRPHCASRARGKLSRLSRCTGPPTPPPQTAHSTTRTGILASFEVACASFRSLPKQTSWHFRPQKATGRSSPQLAGRRSQVPSTVCHGQGGITTAPTQEFDFLSSHTKHSLQFLQGLGELSVLRLIHGTADIVGDRTGTGAWSTRGYKGLFGNAAFNPNSGRFTVPSSGIYFVSAIVSAPSGACKRPIECRRPVHLSARLCSLIHALLLSSLLHPASSVLLIDTMCRLRPALPENRPEMGPCRACRTTHGMCARRVGSAYICAYGMHCDTPCIGLTRVSGPIISSILQTPVRYAVYPCIATVIQGQIASTEGV
jgi:hypothetical protein